MMKMLWHEKRLYKALAPRLWLVRKTGRCLGPQVRLPGTAQDATTVHIFENKQWTKATHSTHIWKHTVEKSHSNITQYKDVKLLYTAQYAAHAQHTLVYATLIKAQTKLSPTIQTNCTQLIPQFNWSPQSHVASMHSWSSTQTVAQI